GVQPGLARFTGRQVFCARSGTVKRSLGKTDSTSTPAAKAANGLKDDADNRTAATRCALTGMATPSAEKPCDLVRATLRRRQSDVNVRASARGKGREATRPSGNQCRNDRRRIPDKCARCPPRAGDRKS